MVATNKLDLESKIRFVKEKYEGLQALYGEKTKLDVYIEAPFEAMLELDLNCKFDQDSQRQCATIRYDNVSIFSLCVFVESIEKFALEITQL